MWRLPYNMRYVGVVVCILTCLYARASCTYSDYDYEPQPDERSEDDYFVSGTDTFLDPTENVIPSIKPPDELFYIEPPDTTNIDSSNTGTTPKPPIFYDDVIHPHDVTIEQLKQKVENLMTEVKSQQDKITDIEKSNRNLQDKVDLLEQQIKTNSIILFNVTENKHESHRATLQKVLHVINRVMKVRVNADDISVALRAGNNSTQDRPIVVRFTNFATKMKVLGARSKLSRTNIVVTGDYSEQVAKRRSELLPFMYRARGQGHSAFLLYDKLVVNGKAKTLEELQAEDKSAESSQFQDDMVEDFLLPL